MGSIRGEPRGSGRPSAIGPDDRVRRLADVGTARRRILPLPSPSGAAVKGKRDTRASAARSKTLATLGTGTALEKDGNRI